MQESSSSDTGSQSRQHMEHCGGAYFDTENHPTIHTELHEFPYMFDVHGCNCYTVVDVADRDSWLPLLIA